MKIFLIRHGEQLYPYDEQGRKLISSPDAPLVELGRIQMQELAKKIGVLDAVYRSPLLRAEQSAEELIGERSIPIYVVDDLKEVEPNSVEGKTFDDLEKIGGDIYAHPFSENQETQEHLIERSEKAIESILSDAKKREYSSIGILGHGDPLSALHWSLRHKDLPTSYREMINEFYPQKGFAYEYEISDDKPFKLTAEGRIVVTDSAKQTIEGF